MYSSSLSTHRCIRPPLFKAVLQLINHQAVQQLCRFAFTSSTDGKWVPFNTLFTLVYRKKSQRNPPIWRMFKYSNAFIGKKLLEQKDVSWGIVLMQHPDFVLPDIRPLLLQDLLHCLSVNTHHVCNHSLTQMSIFANNFTDFLNFLVGFQSRSMTWMLIIFHFLPTLTKSFVPVKHT